MGTIGARSIFSIWFILSLLWGPLPASATERLQLAAPEREPYLGNGLPDKGYVHELVTEVFKKVGYEAEITFSPLARVVLNAENGLVDGMVPAYYDPALKDQYAFSLPFPGDTIGLLKKKSLTIAYPADPNTDILKSLGVLKKYRFGIVRGARPIPNLDYQSFAQLEPVNEDIQNILKLNLNRIDFAVIDKLTAADLITKHAPHLIGQLEFMKPPLATNDFHVAFSKKRQGYARLCEAFNRGLKYAEEDGTLEKIQNKHGLFPRKKKSVGKTTLTIGTVNNSEMILMQRLSKIYEKTHPNIELDWKILEENTLRQRLSSDLAISDGYFDIMTLGLEAPVWAGRGWLSPIKNIKEGYDLDDVFESIRQSLSLDGTLYALPFYAESSMTFYRTDLFGKAGIKMPQTPSYEDIERIAAKIHDPANKIYGLCLRGKPGWGANMALFNTMVNTFGGRWFDRKWTPTIESPEWEQALTAYNKLVTRYGPPTTPFNNFNENKALFSKGYCGMWIDATVAAGMLFNPKESKVHDKLGFAPAPVAVTPKGSHWLWAWALAIPSTSRHYEQALDFITWATSKEYIRLVAKEEGWGAVPPGTRISTYKNSEYRAAAPFADFVMSAIQNADPVNNTLKPSPYNGILFIDIPEYPALGNKLGIEISKVIQGQISVKKALKNMQKTAERKLRASGYIK